MLTLRLEQDVEERIRLEAERENRTKTELVKEAISEYLNKKVRSQSPFLLGEDLFGRYGSGESDRAETYKDRLKELLVAKHAH